MYPLGFPGISIRHTFKDLAQTIDIRLKTGTYNLFWHSEKIKQMKRGNLHYNHFLKESSITCLSFISFWKNILFFSLFELDIVN